MSFASNLALILLALAGYSSGAALAGRGKQVFPGLFDLLVVLVAWAAALATSGLPGRVWAIIVWFVIGLVAGASLTKLRPGNYTRQLQAPAERPESGKLRQWWKKWQAFAANVGYYQGRVLLAFFYFVIVAPFALLVRWFGNPLHKRRADDGSFWVKRPAPEQAWEKARQQF